ncbi:MAG: bifunctional diaminohydroxyphosphoribosylaminopyrimidine deaminase/5-amino-6-(5-phosphoribosylamino)uracil reductase RibD [Lewinellaceae bacterium]|nr:bifunctional diaminohydroxyphosphoribosylaminopyrimidine deaminase/5-amino-6-(5-phosphoribosylamino)uracil reductase RibD [Lewinellaceae bacterium]
MEGPVMANHESYIRRCFELARLGAPYTSPNPQVGAVLVHQNRIIGEGYHQKYGQAHAEVNAVRSVREVDRGLISASTLYVSLEPCSIFGRTPPCTGLILAERIPRVVIAAIDQTPGVAGSGVAQLRQAGVDVITDVLSEEGNQLAQPRNTFVREHRPYVILKMAVSTNGYMAPKDRSRFWLTNVYSRRLAHKWRSEVDAILVGTTTALHDDPQLDNRLFWGPSPQRIVLDRQCRLPAHLQVFNRDIATCVVVAAENWQPNAYAPGNAQVIPIPAADFQLPTILHELAQRNITVLLVEGGPTLLHAFLDAGLWDEARVLRSATALPNGIPAPLLPLEPIHREALADDLLEWYRAPAKR